MSTQILIKRSTTTGAIPTAQDIAVGELAINTVDKRIFTNNSGTIVELGTTPTTQAVTGNASVGGTFDVVGAVTVGNFTADGTVDLTSATVTIPAPTADTHPATKKYVDDEVNAILDGAPAALDTLNEIAAAINDDANAFTTLTNSIATKLPLAGGTMTGAIDMGVNGITTSVDPATDNTLTRKSYVDGLYQSTVDAEDSAAAAAVSETNAANSATSAASSASTATTQASNASTSATNAATSETNAGNSATSSANSATASATSATQSASSASAAATSATSAAASYDAFDDRYLGAKASDPATDNDGNALITGALYFDSTNNVTKVFNGTDWQAASSSIEGIKSDFLYTATASQTVFSGADDNASTLVIDQAGLVNVYLNGVRLTDADYTISASLNSVTLTTGAALNDTVEIEVFGNFAGQSGADVAITGGSITGLTTLGVDGTVTADGLTVDGNVAFTEDTGTTAKFHWDASAENLTIDSSGFNAGSTTSVSALKVRGAFGGGITISDGAESGFYADTTGSNLKMYVGKTASDTPASKVVMTANSSGVDVTGTVTSDGLTVDGGNSLTLNSGAFQNYSIENNVGRLLFIGNSEIMRFDSDYVLIGTTNSLITSTSSGTDADNGVVVADGTIAASRNGGTPLYLNRTASDGDIARFQKNGTVVGSIGTFGGFPTIGKGDTGVLFQDGTDNIQPWNTTTNAGRDAAIDLGHSTGRFKDLYLSGGVYLGGTGAANKLDDYEEGTWTPSPYVSNVNYAKYVKVGKLCYLNFDITMTTSSSSSAGAIGGLPFTSLTTYASGTLAYSTNSTYPDARVEASTAGTLRIRSSLTGGHLTYAQLSGNRLIGTIIYETT